MRSLRDPYRRWLRTMLLFFVWCGIVPVLLTAGYYALSTHTDFDPALSQLRTGTRSGNTLAWAIRIGSASSYRGSIGFVSTSFGFNVGVVQAERHPGQVTAGRELDGTYRATYLAKFHGLAFPVVMTAFRDVGADGRVSYDVEINGFRPIGSYFLFMAGFSVFAVVFFEVVGVVEKRKKQRAAGVSQSQNVANV